MKTSEKQYTVSPAEQPTGSSSFLTDGFVSLCSDPEVKLSFKIWRDSAAFQSVIPQNTLPFNEKSVIGSHALVKGILNLPLHKLILECELISCEVVVALSSELPIDGVTLHLGNDLVGGTGYACVTSHPQPVNFPDESEQRISRYFSCLCCYSCVDQARKMKDKGVLFV